LEPGRSAPFRRGWLRPARGAPGSRVSGAHTRIYDGRAPTAADETIERIRARVDQAFAQTDERTYREETHESEGEHVFVVGDAPDRKKVETLLDEYGVEYETEGTEVRVFVRGG
jgi:hypothetical protein